MSFMHMSRIAILSKQVKLKGARLLDTNELRRSQPATSIIAHVSYNRNYYIRLIIKRLRRI